MSQKTLPFLVEIFVRVVTEHDVVRPVVSLFELPNKTTADHSTHHEQQAEKDDWDLHSLEVPACDFAAQSCSSSQFNARLEIEGEVSWTNILKADVPLVLCTVANSQLVPQKGALEVKGAVVLSFRFRGCVWYLLAPHVHVDE